MDTKVYHKSASTGGSNDWETPDFLFQFLNKTYEFDIDLAASHENHKCARYYTEEDNALIQEWRGSGFLNPPYSHPLQGQFIRKAAMEAEKLYGQTILLIPSRTDTEAWHEYIFKRASRVVFIEGRLHFSYHPDPAGFASAIVRFGAYSPGGPEFSTLNPKSLPGYDDYRDRIRQNAILARQLKAEIQERLLLQIAAAEAMDTGSGYYDEQSGEPSDTV